MLVTAGIKLAVGAVIIIGVTTYMAYVGASSSWKYYVTADECLAQSERLVGNRIRVSGLVSPGSLDITPERSQATFMLAGQDGQLDVVCKGPLPDNLAEAMEVVVEGRYEAGGKVYGEKVLTRCASKYEAAAPEGES